MAGRHRLTAILLLLTLTTACGVATGGEPYRMTVILGRDGSMFYTALGCGAKVEAHNSGMEFELAAPLRWDAAAQSALVRQVIEDESDAVLIAPVDAQAMIAPMRAMKRAGITIVEVDTRVSDGSLGVARVASDNVEAGRLAAREMAERMDERGTVLVLGVGPGTSTTATRADAFVREMRANHPDVTVLDVRHTNDEPERARRIVEETVAAESELTGVFSTNASATLGAAEALHSTGQAVAVTHVGMDAGPDEVEQLEMGGVDVLLAQEPYQIGQRGVREALHALEGEPVQERVTTDLSTITRPTLTRRHHFSYATHEC